MHTTSPEGSSPRLALNVEKLNELRRAHDIKSDAALARLLGIDTSTLYRIQTGDSDPSNAVMARFKVAFPTVALDTLFSLKAAA